MRIFEKEHMILARPRLRLIAIHQHVLRLLAGLGHEAPLHPRRKPRAAAPAHPAGLHGVDNPLGPLSDRILDSLISIQLDVLLDILRALAKPLLQRDHFIRMRNMSRHYLTSFPRPSA